MGQGADDILDGFVCQHCGDIIDERAPGYPRSCSGCGIPISATAIRFTGLSDHQKQIFEDELKKAGYIIESQKEINYGIQYRLKGGSIVNKFQTGRFSVQGKPDKVLKDFMYKLYRERK